MIARTRWTVLLLLAGCQAGVGSNTRVIPTAALSNPGTAVASAKAGEGVPIGTLAGVVGRFDGKAFVPAAGAKVTLGDGLAGATTDAQGAYGFAHVPAGVHQLKAELAGHGQGLLACRLGGLAGLGRANLALVPSDRPAGLAADALAIAGVVVDPRGAALPGGTVRVADSLTKAGNRTAQADGDGFYAATLDGLALTPLTSGQATLTAFGTTPGGVRVESTEALTVPLDVAPTYGVTAATRAFAAPKDLKWVEVKDRRRVLTGSGLPSRRDELVVRFALPLGTAEAAPAAIDGDRVAIDVPAAYGAGASVELLPLGLLPPTGPPASLALDAPIASSP